MGSDLVASNALLKNQHVFGQNHVYYFCIDVLAIMVVKHRIAAFFQFTISSARNGDQLVVTELGSLFNAMLRITYFGFYSTLR